MYKFTSHDTLLLVAVGDGYLEEPNCNAAVDGAKTSPSFWNDVCDYSIMETITS